MITNDDVFGGPEIPEQMAKDLAEFDSQQPEPQPAEPDEVDFAIRYNKDVFSMIGGYFHV